MIGLLVDLLLARFVMGCLFSAAVQGRIDKMESLQAQNKRVYTYDGASVAGNLTSPVNEFQQMKSRRVDDGCGEGEDENVFSIIHRQHNIQIDNIISQHGERIKMEILGSKWRWMKQVATTVEEVAMKKIKTKDEEINRVRQLNAALEDRLRSLSTETRIWKDIATVNENAVVSLRVSLEQALAQNPPQNLDGGDDDAESVCDNLNPNPNPNLNPNHNPREIVRERGGGCRVCGKEDACMLFLPCKHLCLCSGCSTVTMVCPICYCTKQCTLRINLT